MTNDATSRAREAWQAERILATIADALLNDHEAMDCMEQAETIVASLNAVDFQIIDTRTHAAIAREPSEADVERLMRAIDNTYNLLIGGDINNLDQVARAAIAALVGTQTQGGERDDV